MAKKKPSREAKRTAFGCVEAGDVEGLRAVVDQGGDIEAIPRREELSPLGRAVPEGGFAVVKQWTVRVKRRGIGCDDLEQLGCHIKVQ